MSAPQGPPAPPPNSGEPQQPYPGQPYPGQPYPGQNQPSYPTPAYANAPAAKPARITEGPEIGLPPGVAIAELGPRLLAWLIEASVPIVLGIIFSIVINNSDTGAGPLIFGLIATVLDLGWIAFLGWKYTTEAAGPGTKLMGLQLVGMTDGRPLGWGRWILRYLIFGVVSGVSIVNIVFWILLVLNPRRQGWHDLAIGSIMIKAREVAPRPAKPAAAEAAPGPAEAEPTVGIPTSYGTPPPPASFGPGAHYGPVSRSYGGPAPTSAPSAAPVSGPSAPEPSPVVPAPEPTPAPTPEPEPVPEPSSEPGPPPVPPSTERTVTVDDRQVTVSRLALVGRNPQRGPGEEDAEIVKVKDEARTVSKTHLALGVGDGGLWVEDRGSTNGSAVTSPDGVYRLLGAGERVVIQPGWTVSLGQHTITVEPPA